jgi:stage III sporulation protein AD
MTPIIEYVGEIGESFGADESLSMAIEVLLKALGVSILAHVTANICRDAGESSIAYYVELGAKIEILILSLPLLVDVISLAAELLEMS